MIPLQEAIDILLEKTRPLAPETIPLAEALHRAAARDVTSPIDLPPFHRSALDGYAVHYDDVKEAAPRTPVVLPVTGEVVAGQAAETGPVRGEAWKIATGAPLPGSADAMVPYEWTRPAGDDQAESKIKVMRAPGNSAHGRNVSPPGEDVGEGEVLAQRGGELGPGELGLLAATGIDEIEVHRRPRVALVVTGDELVNPGQPLGPGQIYNSNQVQVQSLIREAGAEPLIYPAVVDEEDALARTMDRVLADDPDLIISTGGASVGPRDLIPDFWRDRGAREWFWRVAIKPGKPVFAGVYEQGEQPVQVLGLSGSPAPCAAVFQTLVRPVIRRLAGFGWTVRPVVRARLADGYRKGADMTRLLWAIVRETGSTGYEASLAPVNDMPVLKGLAAANGLVIMPQGSEPLEAGQTVRVLVLDRREDRQGLVVDPGKGS